MITDLTKGLSPIGLPVISIGRAVAVWCQNVNSVAKATKLGTKVGQEHSDSTAVRRKISGCNHNPHPIQFSNRLK